MKADRRACRHAIRQTETQLGKVTGCTRNCLCWARLEHRYHTPPLQWSHLDPLLMRDVAFWNLKPLVNHAVALARGGRGTHFVVGPSVVRHLCVTSCYDMASGLVLRAFVRVFLASVPERPPFFCWLRDLKTKKPNNDCQFKPIRLFPLKLPMPSCNLNRAYYRYVR